MKEARAVKRARQRRVESGIRRAAPVPPQAIDGAYTGNNPRDRKYAIDR